MRLLCISNFQVLHSGHSIYHFSQSGCKLLFFTDYGMRHVIAYLVVCFFLHAYLVVFQNFDQDNLDGRMRANIPWFIITIFLVEGELERVALSPPLAI